MKKTKRLLALLLAGLMVVSNSGVYAEELSDRTIEKDNLDTLNSAEEIGSDGVVGDEVEDPLLMISEGTGFAGGNGSEENPYQVATASQLYSIRNDLTSNYILVSDIDLANWNWHPIGDRLADDTDEEQEPFTGSFDGNGFVIRNLTIRTREKETTYGLFGENRGIIENVILENCDISVNLNSVIECGYIPVIGSIAGQNEHMVFGCQSSGSIRIFDAYDAYIGGIVGLGTTGYSKNYCNINVTGILDYNDHAANVVCGGIVGETMSVNGIVENCINYGEISASADTFLKCGGISGEDGAIRCCVNYGRIEGTVYRWKGWSSFAANCNVGGIVGATSADTLDDCINFGSVSAFVEEGSCYSGGIAGFIGYYSSGSIKNCYNVGSYIHSDDVAGRIAGTLIPDNASSLFSIYSTTIDGDNVPIDIGENTVNGMNMTETQISTAIQPILRILELTWSGSISRNTVYYDGDKSAQLEKGVLDIVPSFSSTVYNPYLAEILMGFSTSVYNETLIMKTYDSFGFTNIKTYKYVDQDYGLDSVAYAIGETTTEDGTKIVLISVRGTSPIEDWISDVHLGLRTLLFEGWLHKGFAIATDVVCASLEEYLGGIDTNAKYVITGHSRGGAVANLLEFGLTYYKGVSKNNIYGYNFACPDVARMKRADWINLQFENIFNIANSADPVPLLPGNMADFIQIQSDVLLHLWDMANYPYWGKFGNSAWYDYIYTNIDVEAHKSEHYFDYMSKHYPFTSYYPREYLSTKGLKAIIRCPVDVVVKDKNGNTIASVINNIPNYHNSKPGDVIIIVEGEEKAIFLKDQDVEFSFTATGNGEMTLLLEYGSLGNTKVADDGKIFKNVALEEGKTIKTNTTRGTSIDNTKLYVVENGERVTEINTEGEETPITTVDAGQCGDNLTWKLTSDGTLTIKGFGEMWNYDFADNIGDGATNPWDSYRNNIYKVDLDQRITRIGDFAFYEFKNLIQIEIPESVSAIGQWSFCSCESLPSIQIPESVSSIGQGAFDICNSIQSITIPSNVTEISYGAFADCDNLVTVEIKGNVSHIVQLAFAKDKSLKKIYFYGEAPTNIENTSFLNVNSIVYYPANNSSWTDQIMQDYGGTLEWRPWGMQESPTLLFDTTLTLPGSITTIESESFASIANEVNILIPDTVTYIDPYAFKDNEYIIILGKKGGYVEQYCRDNNIAFVPQ